MAKILLSLFFSFLCVMHSFGELTHTVLRGESIESIAKKYDIPMDNLIDANSGIEDLFYVGLKISIPEVETSTAYNYQQKFNQSTSESKIGFEESSLSGEAQNNFEKKNWGKSVKYYNKLVKRYPKAVYYYNRGLAYFNNNKNRQAANDLRQALSMEDCTESMKNNGPNILAEAERRHSEWSERNSNLIGGLVLGAAAVGLTTWAIVESAKAEPVVTETQTSNYYNTGNNIPSLGQNGDMNAVFNQIMAKSIEEVCLQEQVEYNKAREAWIQMTGNDLSYDQWCRQKGQALMEMQQNGNSYNDNSDDNGNYWDTENREKRRNDILDTVTGGVCGLCKGTGRCHACGGTHVVSSLGQTYLCTLCNDKGDCPHCHGTGKPGYKVN